MENVGSSQSRQVAATSSVIPAGIHAVEPSDCGMDITSTPRKTNRLIMGTVSPHRGWNGYVIRFSILCWRAVCRCFEQGLDVTNVGPTLEQMGCKRMTQRMQTHTFGDARRFRRRVKEAAQLACGEMLSPPLPGE